MILSFWSLAPLLLLLWLVEKSWRLWQAFNQLQGYPAQKLMWVHPFRTLVILLGGNLPQGTLGSWYTKFSLYAKYGSTCIASVNFWTATPIYWFCDAEAIKIMGQQREIFIKDVEVYEALKVYGENSLAAEGAVWKRHRAVVKSAFNEKNNAFLWTEAIHIVNQWFDHLNRYHTAGTGSFQISIAEEFSKLTLLTIAAAGFGRRLAWNQMSDKIAPDLSSVHKLSFREAVVGSIDSLTVQSLAPEWLYPIARVVRIPFVTPLLQRATDCFDGTRQHMFELISAARAWVRGDSKSQIDATLLTHLVEANMAQEGQKTLSDQELLSEVYAFLLAGNETTSRALGFTVLILALHPHVQERIFEEAYRLWPDGVPASGTGPSYKESMAALSYTAAAFHEALRMVPPVARLSKVVAQDASIKAHHVEITATGEMTTAQPFDVHMQKGSTVIFDVTALHYNPIYWGNDVEVYNPERFIDTEAYHWPRDAFVAFSTGHRGCIGQRFALTESVCYIASLVRKYEILVPENVRELPFQERKERLLRWLPGMTSTPVNPFVQLCPRKFN